MGKKNRDLDVRTKVDIPPDKRLTSKYYNQEECRLAIQGRQIPQGLGHKTVQACVVRGIRLHPGFATELYGSLPVFTRALNARRIMSDDIPDMMQAEETPYCIWFPVVGKEDTYRELVARYPYMKYHVGRACAVAGYTKLYHELDLSPEVHIAEEARDNGSHDIFEMIMKHREKCSIMDDYAMKVNITCKSPSLRYLNGDTAVRSSLDIKRECEGYALQRGTYKMEWTFSVSQA